MTEHDLKIWPEYFQAVLVGRKPWEVRENDRGFKEGDHLILREWDPSTELYTGRKVVALVTYLVPIPLMTNHVGMTIRRVM